MTSVLGLSMPKIGIGNDDLTKPKTLALGGIAATAVVGGGVIGAIKKSPLAGLGIGAAIAAVSLGAALVGNASDSRDYPYDPDVYYDDYHHDHYYGDPYGVDRDHDGAREDYPSGGEYYPGGSTSYGDNY